MKSESPFARSDTEKDMRMAQLRQRLAAATPPSRPGPGRPRLWLDWRGLAALGLALLFLLAGFLGH